MDERARRVGQNEALFRQVNERIEQVNRDFAALTSRIDVVCECGDGGCAERIVLSVDEYERVRRDPTWFILLPGHDEPDVEDVIEDHDGWIVVQKRPGEPAQIARETDTRA